MPIPLATTKSVYLLKQHLEIKERQTDQSPLVQEVSDQQSLLLVTSEVKDLQWQRTIEEYRAPAELLKGHVAGKVSVSREDLADLHQRALQRMKILFGLQIPLYLQTNIQNQNVGIKPPDTKAVPATYQALHLPTFLPEFPQADWQVDATWTGQSKIAYGFAEFNVRHTVKCISKPPGSINLQIDLVAEDSAWSEKTFAFTLRPAGSWVLTVDALNRSPMSAKGKFQLVVNGRLSAKDQPPRQAELLNCSSQFEYAQVPISFDEKTVNAIAWRV